MKSKYLIILIIMFLIFISPVKAESCDTEDIERLTTIANHVDLSYTIEKYEDEEYDPYEYDMYIYNFKISNLTEELYVVSSSQGIKNYFYYEDINDGVITMYNFDGGTYQMDIYSTKCEKKLNTINITLPYYNQYSNSDKCQEEGYKEQDFCQEWTTNYIDSDTYTTKLEKYTKTLEEETEQNDITSEVLRFLQKYYIYLIPIPIVIIIIISIIIIRKKRGELE